MNTLTKVQAAIQQQLRIKENADIALKILYSVLGDKETTSSPEDVEAANVAVNTQVRGTVAVDQIDPENGQVVATFPSQTAAAKAIGAHPASISGAVQQGCKCKGHFWRRTDGIVILKQTQTIRA